MKRNPPYGRPRETPGVPGGAAPRSPRLPLISLISMYRRQPLPSTGHNREDTRIPRRAGTGWSKTAVRYPRYWAEGRLLIAGTSRASLRRRGRPIQGGGALRRFSRIIAVFRLVRLFPAFPILCAGFTPRLLLDTTVKAAKNGLIYCGGRTRAFGPAGQPAETRIVIAIGKSGSGRGLISLLEFVTLSFLMNFATGLLVIRAIRGPW
jgi:hypothetical protein